MDTRLPYFEGQKDFMSYLRFLDNREEYEVHAAKLDERTAKFLDAVKLYGQAKDIERKHELAEAWEDKARNEFGEREEKLVAGEKALAKEQREKGAKLTEREAEIEQVLRAGNHELTRRDVTLKAREAEVAKREQAAEEATAKAQEAHEAALETKRAVDAQVKRIKEAVAV